MVCGNGASGFPDYDRANTTFTCRMSAIRPDDHRAVVRAKRRGVRIHLMSLPPHVLKEKAIEGSTACASCTT